MTIGLLGLGSFSTLYYLKQLNADYQKYYGGYATCPLLLLNTNFHAINSNLPDQYQVLQKELQPYLKKLTHLQIDHLIIPNITLHHTWDLINYKYSFSYTISHPIQLTIKALKDQNHQHIYLFGTKYTMSSKEMINAFSNEGIEILNIPKEDIEFIDEIRRCVYDDSIDKVHLDKFNKLVVLYSQKFPVILACTELSIALQKPIDNVYDMAQIQINDTLKKLIDYDKSN